MENRLRRRIGCLEGIGSPSDSLDRILALAADCESDIGDLTDAIASDPAVTSRVLRLSNSAYFGAARQVETLDRAILVIGYKNVMSLATCAALAPLFSGSDSCIDRSALWRHCCATGEAARLLAGRGSFEPAASFIAGLLHDLGAAVLSEVIPDEYAEIVETAQRAGRTLYEVEMERLGVDHGWAAGILFERWTLSERLVTAVTAHHHPDADPSGFAALIGLADWMAAAGGYVGPTGWQPREAPPASLLEPAGIKPESFEEASEEFEERRDAIELSSGTSS